jgi:transposase
VLLDERIAPLDQKLGPLARADRRCSLLTTIPGTGAVLGRTIAAEIGEVVRFPNARKLVGCAGLAPRVKQSGERSRSGELSRAGSRPLRFVAVEAAQGAWREANPWHRLYSDVKACSGKANPAKSAAPARS